MYGLNLKKFRRVDFAGKNRGFAMSGMSGSG